MVKVMVELAKQAFTNKNFELAAEIYEQAIKKKGPNVELLLGLADSLARGGKFREALVSYVHAFRYGDISCEKLKHLVTGLTEIFNEKEQQSGKISEEKVDFFSCLLCHGLLYEPATIPCGHTFCKHCLDKEKTKVCKKCGIYHLHLQPSNLKTNILIANLTEKWFPKEINAAKLKMQGNEHFRKQQFEAAVEFYNKAFELAPHDHLIASNRSHVYASQEKFIEALKDAELAIKLKPNWSKGYFHKGAALAGLCRYAEAMITYLHCLILDPNVSSTRNDLAQILHKMLSPLPSQEIKRTELPQALASAVSRVLEPFSWQNVESLKTTSQDTQNFNHFNFNNAKNADDNFQLNENNKLQQVPPLGNILENCIGIESLKKDISGSQSNQQKNLVTLNAEYIDRNDFECTLCCRLFFEPVTTPCGHIFCRMCLDRCLDHSQFCPLCKYNLAEYLAERRQSVTEFIESILEKYLPEAYAERRHQHDEEMAELASMGKDSQHEIPIFICTMAYPTVPCPLHVFEPRYRLMIRQSMESGTRQFGMCTYVDGDEGFANYGTMLEIRDVQYFQDGRSVVDTVGGRRFKVTSRGMRDGYHTAQVEFLKDIKVDGQEAVELKQLHDQVHSETLEWFETVHANTQRRILQHFGPMPDLEMDFQASCNGPAWSWWILAILPLDSRAQLPILSEISLKERLLAIQRVLQFITRKSI